MATDTAAANLHDALRVLAGQRLSTAGSEHRWPAVRDGIKDHAWFDEWIAYEQSAIGRFNEEARRPPGDPAYRPQFLFDLAKKHLHLLLRRYSRGDPVADLAQHLPPLLDSWEEAERLGRTVWTEQQQFARHAWSANLDHYIRSFWLVGLALALDMPDPDWQRLLALLGNEGEDALLDRVIATRQPGRRIGTRMCHPQPYERLMAAVVAPPARQGALLRDFVDRWYDGLDRPPKKGLSRDTAMYERPYWHGCDEAEGAYFGYWCVEAVAAVKAFGIDDTACLGAAHYPGDLLRPAGPTTHARADRHGADAHQAAASGLRSTVRRFFGGRQP